MPSLPRFIAVAIALCVELLLPDATRAETAAYPSRPIRLVVPFSPGGPTDILARIIADPLSRGLGQSVYIENRAGANGNVGMAAVARAEPDGYTLLVSSTAIVINPAMYKTLPFDAEKDFAPIAELGFTPILFVVRNDSDIKSFDDLVARAKAQPGQLNYASVGVGTQAQLTAELMKLRVGLDIVHVAYNGGGAVAQAVAAGTTQLGSVAASAAEGLIESGVLRGLAVTARQRWFSLPQVPTMMELGYPAIVSEAFQGLLAPAGTPPDVVRRLANDVGQILKSPDFIARARRAGFDVIPGTPDAFAKRIAKEIPEIKDMVRRAGLEAR
jgi:tripartite-type tricarboxylate transporter receptor subunit TctC